MDNINIVIARFFSAIYIYIYERQILRGAKMDKGTCKPFKTLMSVNVRYGHHLFFILSTNITP